jgi:hypothetical protein
LLIHDNDVRLAEGCVVKLRPMIEFFVIGERIVVPGGVTFYTFVKSATASSSAAVAPAAGGAAKAVLSR